MFFGLARGLYPVMQILSLGPRFLIKSAQLLVPNVLLIEEEEKKIFF